MRPEEYYALVNSSKWWGFASDLKSFLEKRHKGKPFPFSLYLNP